jgi:hypothetical protein
LDQVPKDPAISGNAEDGVFAYVQAYAARSGRMRLAEVSCRRRQQSPAGADGLGDLVDVTKLAVLLIGVAGTLGGTLGRKYSADASTESRTSVLIVNVRRGVASEYARPGAIFETA